MARFFELRGVQDGAPGDCFVDEQGKEFPITKDLTATRVDIPAESYFTLNGEEIAAAPTELAVGDRCGDCRYNEDSERCHAVHCDMMVREDGQSVVFMGREDFLLKRLKGEI